MVVAINPASELDAEHTREKIERHLRLAFTRYTPSLRQVDLNSRLAVCPDLRPGYLVSIRASVHGAPDVAVDEINRSLSSALQRATRRIERSLKQQARNRH